MAAALAFKVDTRQAPLERWIGGLGMPGWTAYFGLLEVGQPKAGETLVVSAASGAVGSVVGQIGRIKGLRVVGIAGGAEKCRYLTEDLGFDDAVDYKAGNLAEDLRAACPAGIDIDFENVGGAIFDTVLAQMNLFGRIVLCGLISAYNGTEPQPGLKNFRAVLVNRLRVQGLIVFDWATRYPEAIAALGAWHADGKLKLREDVRDGGIAAYPAVLNLLYSGGNFGKLVLRVRASLGSDLPGDHWCAPDCVGEPGVRRSAGATWRSRAPSDRAAWRVYPIPLSARGAAFRPAVQPCPCQSHLAVTCDDATR